MGDDHPLARLSVTIGVLADLLHGAELDAADNAAQLRQATTLTRHLLAIGRLVAGETFRRGAYSDATRPLVVAQYCERALDSLSDTRLSRTGLSHLRAVHPLADSPDLGDRLEAAVHAWDAAARGEAGRVIPSTEVLRTITLQAIHLYAVTQQALTLDGADTLDPDAAASAALRDAAAAADKAAPGWAPLHSHTRPSLAFATASRDLFTILDDLTPALDPRQPDPTVDPLRALTDLRAAARAVHEIAAQTRRTPQWLVLNQQVHVPNPGRKTILELNHRRFTRPFLRPATFDDLGTFPDQWRRFGSAAHAAATQLDLAIDRHPRWPVLPAPIERSL